jgi:DNA-binding CsgD family transcriptional regulator
MVGRQAELRDLDIHLTAVLDEGRGRVVLLAGEAGVGKTRLTRAFVERSRARTGIEVFQGHCHDEDPAVPYGPFVDALRAVLRVHGAEAVLQAAGPWGSDLVIVLPELAPAPAASDPQGLKRRLFEAIRRVLLPWGAGHCRLLLLEDLHWADQTSQELLNHLARSILDHRILILGTYRGEELHRRHPFARLLAELTRERLSHELRLSPLSRDELARMLETTLERPLPLPLVDILYDRSGGNPFFLEELLKALLEQYPLEALIQSAQEGRGIAHLAIPLSLKEGILRRASDLDQATSSVLTYAAVIGRRFDFELLLRLTGMEEAALLRAVEALVERQLVEEEAGGLEDRYSFRHALTREAIYDDLLGRERRLKHRAVLQALEETYGATAEGVIDQLAYHSLQARDPAKAARYARLAGERAARMSAYREAVAHYEVALNLLDAADLLGRAELYEKLAEAAYPLGDTNQYQRYWQEARQLYDQLGDRRKVAGIYRRLGRVSWERGETKAAFELTKAAVAVLETEPPGHELAMAYSEISRLHMLSTRSRESVEWGERALRLADELGDEAVTAHTLNHVGGSLIELGQRERGLAYMERSLEMANRLDLQFEALRAYNNLGDMLACLGEYQRAAGVLREGIALADRLGFGLFKGFLRHNLGETEMRMGHWEQAWELLDQAILAGEMGYPVARLSALPNKGELLLRQGRLEEAQRTLEEELPLAEWGGEFQKLHGWLSTLARVHLARGNLDQAVAIMDRCVALWRPVGPQIRATRMLGYGVEVYLAAGRGDRIQELLSALATLSRDAVMPLAPASFEDVQGLVAAQEARHDEAAAHYQRAAERWQAMACPFEEARARRRRAESLLPADDPSARAEAARELAAAREIFARLGAALELEIVDLALKQHGLAPRSASAAAGRGNPLTPREREVLSLIARGCSNREIAQELFISAKTAEIHVGNILGKLGCGSRAQAAVHAVAHGLVEAPDP